MKNLVFVVVASALAVSAFANPESPYSGEDARNIKALSQQEVEGYLNGNGMGFAKAAELNHYPGPGHVLDLSRELALSEEQAAQAWAVFNTMKDRASELGRQLVRKEQELDHQFANGSIDSETLEAHLSDIGTLQAQIRYVHLSAHLQQKALLTQHQIHQYDQLRGYGISHNTGHGDSH